MSITLWIIRGFGGALLAFCLWALLDEGMSDPYAIDMIIASLMLIGMFIGDGITTYKFKKRLLP